MTLVSQVRIGVGAHEGRVADASKKGHNFVVKIDGKHVEYAPYEVVVVAPRTREVFIGLGERRDAYAKKVVDQRNWGQW